MRHQAPLRAGGARVAIVGRNKNTLDAVADVPGAQVLPPQPVVHDNARLRMATCATPGSGVPV
jgi:hypothetical protein